ncbi:hypothetical protein HJG60_009204 [Phyllostomus discolor]|uniref:Uncharacterized protein n=1 Tax=Phyllostomus discolor TaxID=89673 RepID=A0A833YMC4_9CHIR|nr:hypothetical protein HJG60_009204 [Phyllostomus discolor]
MCTPYGSVSLESCRCSGNTPDSVASGASVPEHGSQARPWVTWFSEALRHLWGALSVHTQTCHLHCFAACDREEESLCKPAYRSGMCQGRVRLAGEQEDTWLWGMAKIVQRRPGQCGSVGWSVVPYPKGCRFDSQSETMWSPVWAHTGVNQSMFLSHVDVPLSPFLSL